MATVMEAKKQRVTTMRLCDVLELFIKSSLKGTKLSKALDGLWGEWCGCKNCHLTIAPAAPMLSNGNGFVHAGCIKDGEAVAWDEVTLPGHRGSVSKRLEQKKEREEQAQEAA